MNLKKLTFFLFTITTILITTTFCKAATTGEQIYKEAKAFAGTMNNNYISPALQAVILEQRQGWYETEHEKLGKENQKLTIKNNEETLKQTRATKINTTTGTAISYCNGAQLDPAKKAECKELMEKINKIIKKEIDDLAKEELTETPQQTSTDSSAKTETDKKTEPNTPGETPKTEPASTEVTPKNDTDKKTEKAPDNKGFIAKLSALLCPPIVAQGIDTVAQACGVQTFAQWLVSQSPLLTGKETTISRGLTFSGAVVISVALYKAYQIFSSEDDDDQDELDIFSEDFNVNKNR